MKTPKIFLLIILLLMSYCHVKAQSFNVKAGLNYSTIISKDKDGNYSGEYTMKPGFHGGITIDIPLIEFITLESGLILSTKGFKSEVENQSIKVNRNLTSYYMDIPILIKGLHSVKDELEIFGVFGPYLSYGIHGKAWRSEEHTSELQSRGHLVCRLLLET